MDHPYQSTMQFPAAYAVITEEEMTYLDGGREITLFRGFGHELTLNTQQFAVFCTAVAINGLYMMSSTSFKYLANVAQTGYNSGLGLTGTFFHVWDKMDTWSRMASVGVAGLAGFYAYTQVKSIIGSLKNLYDTVFNPMPTFDTAQTQTDAAAAAA